MCGITSPRQKYTQPCSLHFPPCEDPPKPLSQSIGAIIKKNIVCIRYNTSLNPKCVNCCVSGNENNDANICLETKTVKSSFYVYIFFIYLLKTIYFLDELNKYFMETTSEIYKKYFITKIYIIIVTSN